jgi:hypothetical protein
MRDQKIVGDILALYWENSDWLAHHSKRRLMISEWKESEIDEYYNNFYDYLHSSEYVTVWKKKEIDNKGIDTRPLTEDERRKIWQWALEDIAEDGLPLWQEVTKDGGFRIGINRSAAEFGKKFMKQIRENGLYEKLKNDGIF